MGAGNNGVALIVISILIVAMMVDISLARVYDLIVKQPTSSWRIIVFGILISLCMAGQFYVLGFSIRKMTEIRNLGKLHIVTIGNIVRLCQLAIGATIIFIFFQIIFRASYYTPMMVSVVTASYGMSSILLAFLSLRFISWFRSNKNVAILLYALASASLSAHAGLTLLYVDDVIINDNPIEMKPYSAGTMVLIPPNSITAVLNSAFFVSSVGSFALLWVATATLLHQYSKKLGLIGYWTIISSPLILFMAQFASVFSHIFDPFLNSTDPVSFTVWITTIFTLSKPVGGILFATGFFIVARKFRQSPVLKNYLIVSSFGFVLLFVADQGSVLLVAPFPPFGIASASLVGIASFMVLVGIYSSAVSISEDARLRQMLRSTTLDQSKLLDSMGTAQMKAELQNRVLKVMKDNSEKMINVIGTESLPTDDELKDYVEDIMKEIHAEKERKSQL
jgi:hypothetical protein